MLRVTGIRVVLLALWFTILLGVIADAVDRYVADSSTPIRTAPKEVHTGGEWVELGMSISLGALVVGSVLAWLSRPGALAVLVLATAGAVAFAGFHEISAAAWLRDSLGDLSMVLTGLLIGAVLRKSRRRE